jgi:hypothetical protein
MLRAALQNTSTLLPIHEIEESEAAEADFKAPIKRKRCESSESIDASVSTQASPLMAADLAAMCVSRSRSCDLWLVSSPCILALVPSVAAANPDVAGSHLRRAEDLGILKLPPSALSIGTKLITTTVHVSDLPDMAVDITEQVVHEQHARWQKKMRAMVQGLEDNKTRFILSQALDGDPHTTLRAVMSLSPAQVELLPEKARELINTTRSRVLERMRNLSAGKPVPRRYDISSRP